MAEAAMQAGDFVSAKTLFFSARALLHDDSLTHRLALATYKSRIPTEVAALEEAKAILQDLNPEVSNDPETLGLWGAIHKRLWTKTEDRPSLDTAVLAYQRGFDIRTDYYNGINLAFLFNLRARVSSPAEAIADFVTAERVRRRVIPLCQAHLDGAVRDKDEEYWVTATLAEAYLGIGDKAAGDEWLKKAYDLPVAKWMHESTAEQLAQLSDLLEPSPLDLIRPA